MCKLEVSSNYRHNFKTATLDFQEIRDAVYWECCSKHINHLHKRSSHRDMVMNIWFMAKIDGKYTLCFMISYKTLQEEKDDTMWLFEWIQRRVYRKIDSGGVNLFAIGSSCWLLGDAKSQAISNWGRDMVISNYSSFNTEGWENFLLQCCLFSERLFDVNE